MLAGDGERGGADGDEEWTRAQAAAARRFTLALDAITGDERNDSATAAVPEAKRRAHHFRPDTSGRTSSATIPAISAVMEKTKTGLRQRLTIPEALMKLLESHIDRLPEGPMKESVLLFPSERQFSLGVLSRQAVRRSRNGAEAEEADHAAAMRRTFQDLTRAAEVKDIVTRAVSRHATEATTRRLRSQ